MSESRLALAMTGGGARGAYQAGLLAGIADQVPADMRFPVVTGVSAGGINAAAIASHRDGFGAATEHLTECWRSLDVDKVFRADFLSLGLGAARWAGKLATGGAVPLELRGLLDTGPLREFLGEAIDFDGVRANVDAGRLRALALSATSYSTGSTVTFVQGVAGLGSWERARRSSITAEIGIDHVLGSAALPLVFPAVLVGEDYYGDGAIRQAAPLAPAVHLGADRILALSVRYGLTEKEGRERQIRGYPPPAQILGMLMHGVFIDALENDAERMERINRTLELIPEGAVHPDGLRRVENLVLRPSRDLGKLSAGLVGSLPRSLRLVARGLGASRTTTPDFLSYLLFERPYIERLLELGWDDAHDQWDRIEAFLA